MEKKLIIRNIGCSLLLQVVTMISRFVIPKLILSSFGSDINGLTSSITQLLDYIQLLEGGLGGVVMAALYKPLAEKDEHKISAIINATQNFFNKLGLIYVVYMLAVAFIYPLVVDTGFSFWYSFSLVIVLGSGVFVLYFFAFSFKLLLNADRKVYIVSIMQSILMLINMIALIFLIRYFKDILIIKLVSALIYLTQPFVYRFFVKKYYNLDKTVPPDNEALANRWSGFGINLAYFVHTNTDIVILTAFAAFSDISVYVIYLMVVNAMKTVIIAISQAVIPSFGKAVVTEDAKTLNDRFELYEFGIYFVTTVLFTCGLFLITPFIRVYTADIHDADYEQYLFGYILTLAEMMYSYRDPYLQTSLAAGHFKQVTKYAVAEVVVNLTISILLVRRFGITGVAIGTLAAVVTRGIAHVIYLKNNILMRSPLIAVKKMLLFGVTALVTFLLSNLLLEDSAASYFEWIILGFKEFAICIILISGMTLVFFRPIAVRILKDVTNRIRIR